MLFRNVYGTLIFVRAGLAERRMVGNFVFRIVIYNYFVPLGVGCIGKRKLVNAVGLGGKGGVKRESVFVFQVGDRKVVARFDFYGGVGVRTGESDRFGYRKGVFSRSFRREIEGRS